MSEYRNLTANLNHPRTQLDRTAVAVVHELMNTPVGVRVPAHQLDAAIRAAGCDVRYKPLAMKALRNQGWAVICVKARQHSWYMLAATATEYEDHRQRVVREGYSQVVTTCRELAGAVSAQPTDLQLGASLKHAQMLAISLGTDTAVGKSIGEVVAEVAVLP